MEDDIIDLTQLENIPNPALLQILETMDPKSLINICDQSTRIRDVCRYKWKDFFKRDVTSTKWCKGPVNWGKFYKLAMDYIPAYHVNMKIPNSFEGWFPWWSGSDSNYYNYDHDYISIGFSNTIAKVLKSLHDHRPIENEDYDWEDADEEIIRGMQPDTKIYKGSFPLEGNDVIEVTIKKFDKGLLIKDILAQPTPLKEEVSLFEYDVETTKNEYKKGKLVNKETKISKNVLLGKNEILWRLKRILIDEHNFSGDEAEKFISMNEKKIPYHYQINKTFNTSQGNNRKSFHVKIMSTMKGTMDKETIERFLLGICDVVNKKH